MYSFSKYREQYRQNLRLAGPVVMSQAGIVLTQLVDTAMVGRLGAAPLAGVSFGSTVFMTFFIFCMGITMGSTPLVGASYATRNHKASAVYLQNSLVLYLAVGLAAFTIQMASIPLLHHLRQPAEVVAQAIPYYKYLVWSIIPFMLYACFKQFLEGVGNTKVAMWVVLSSNIVNIIFNWLLIYGKCGFPEMGAAGAGLATLISRVAGPVALAVYFICKENLRRYFKFFSVANFTWRNIRTLLSVGTPIASQMFMEFIAFGATTLMMGWIGTVQMGANKIAMDVSNFAFMMVQGIGAATTIRISHEYGRRNLRQLKLAANASFHIAVVWNVLTALAFIALRGQIPRIFTDDPEVIRMASYLLIFAGVFQISDGLQVITIGILRGMQDVRSVMRIAFVSYIIVSLPLGYLLGFTLDWGPGGLWTGLILGLASAALLLIRRFGRHYADLRRKSLEAGRSA